ncbi:MAG: DNA repair protein RadC [Dehalococcoidia bacterium]|nr:DNA repair protein RadC [Dehalococcoidia bacterium]MCL4230537.1 DNA repair protein RadC [Dehalococcoidia bacterium]
MSEAPARSSPYRTIRELADDERPRERLLRHGPEVLGDAELVAILLGSGVPGENVVDLARRMIEGAGGLAGLVRSDAAALQRTKGLGPAKAAQVVAAVELGRRAGRLDPDSRPLLTTPEAVFALMGPLLAGKAKEQLFVLGLDTRGRLLGQPMAIAGGVSSVAVRAAEVFREPVVLEATSAILVHNHPSGDPRPSPQDVAVTRELVAAGELLGISVLDHVVIGQGRFVSMKREGMAFAKR